MEPINFYLSKEGDPWFNLTLEDYILKTMDPRKPVLFLWRNRPSVILGRYQNPWNECHIKAIKTDSIDLVRRQSGGGTVYHDWGNTNFSFLAGNEIYTDKTAFQIILDALTKWEIKAEVSERNDLVINNRGTVKKFSGSAFRKLKDRSFHHGTLLIKTDLTRLNYYLAPRENALEAKGVRSVRSEVINLSDINVQISHEKLLKSIRKSFGAFFGKPVRTSEWSKTDFQNNILFQNEYEKITSPFWTYGKTPPFVHHIKGLLESDRVEAKLFIKEGRIERFETCHTKLSGFQNDVNSLITGIPYQRECVEKALAGTIEVKEAAGGKLKKFTKLLPKAISQFIMEGII